MWDSTGKIDTYTLFSKASRFALKHGLNPFTGCFRFKCCRFVKSILSSDTALGACAIQT